MASRNSIPSSVPWADFGLGSIPDQAAKPLPYILTVFLFLGVLYTLSSKRSSSTIPLLNPPKPLEFTDSGAKTRFSQNARDIVINWFRANPDKPARIIADIGEVTILPSSFINEIRNHPDLSFSKVIVDNFHSHLPGFEGFREGGRDSGIVQQVIMKDLTKYLNKVTEPLSEETTLVTREVYPGSADNEWTSVNLRNSLLCIVSRISSRVFLGEEVCRNEAWLKVTRDYTMNAFRAAQELRMWPYPTRFIVHWFLPLCRQARADIKEARRIINPVLEKRRQQKASSGDVKFDDAIEWFEREAKGDYYDPAVSQAVISLAAIHTTTDLAAQVMIDVVQHPEIIQPLRDEMVSAIREHGWKKTSLYNMKLLDSVIKESQRIRPINLVSMRRLTLKPITLPDGTVIPSNSIIAASASRMWDAAVYPEPEKWIPTRFLDMRGTEKEHLAHLVSTGPEHLGFGHGQHACPGRFFAANEIKIILIHMLLRYDWRLIPGKPEPKSRNVGLSLSVDPFVSMEYKRREPEIEF